MFVIIINKGQKPCTFRQDKILLDIESHHTVTACTKFLSPCPSCMFHISLVNHLNLINYLLSFISIHLAVCNWLLKVINMISFTWIKTIGFNFSALSIWKIHRNRPYRFTFQCVLYFSLDSSHHLSQRCKLIHMAVVSSQQFKSSVYAIIALCLQKFNTWMLKCRNTRCALFFQRHRQKCLFLTHIVTKDSNVSSELKKSKINTRYLLFYRMSQVNGKWQYLYKCR